MSSGGFCGFCGILSSDALMNEEERCESEYESKVTHNLMSCDYNDGLTENNLVKC